ncbi:tetratricopeptide repeat protein [Acaryochloris sp. IP29b_bin.137]|uniref:tetratricopeptide repeat protein n=1 Tax=Acaryochloris sp. IP29b_bin.137 TaxID=2969217 RepID=UPI00261FC047|nr:tetratricopeptide repeat protein [Acaryochloris sp. IP29b_bin.137]
MLVSPHRYWLLFTLLAAGGLAIGIGQDGSATPHGQPHPSPLENIALSREDRSQILFSAGIQKALRGDYAHAIEDYDQALKLAPSNSEVYYNRGVAYFSINRPQNALQDFSQAIALQPKMAEAYGNRGLIRQTLGDRQGALADYQQARLLFQQKGDFPAAQQMEHWINQHEIPK